MSVRRKLASLCIVGGVVAASVTVAAPANAFTYAEPCYQVFGVYGDLCLFYNSGYHGSDTGYWYDGYAPPTYQFSTNGSQSWDWFQLQNAAGYHQAMWHNMGSDENYDTVFTGTIFGAGGAVTTVYPDTSNNLGGSDYNIDEGVSLN